MADAIHGPTQTGPTKQDLIAALVQKELAFNAVLAQTVTDVSAFAVAGSKSISFPKMTSFSVTKRPLGTPGDATVLGSAVDQMNLDQNAYIAYVYDSSDMIQAAAPWQLELARRAAAAHGRGVDLDIIAVLRNIAQAVATNVTNEDLILDFKEAMTKANGNLAATVILAAPSEEKKLLKVDNFVKSDSYGNQIIAGGLLGRLYGMPVIVHNGLNDGEIFAYEKSSMVLGFQKAPAMSEQLDNRYGSGGMRVAMDQLYGIAGQQIQVGAAPAGKSAVAFKIGV